MTKHINGLDEIPRNTNDRTGGGRDVTAWRIANVQSSTVFIVEGCDGPIGQERPALAVTTNFFDALAARRKFGTNAGKLFLFTKLYENLHECTFGHIRRVVGDSAISDLFVSLVGGEEIIIDSQYERRGRSKVRNASVLYSLDE